MALQPAQYGVISWDMIRFDNHVYKGLDASLRRLVELIDQMGNGVSALVDMLPGALEAADAEQFAAAKALDKTINSAESEVESTVAGMINKFTLIGEDLRFALAAIKVSGTLERMADKIKNCTKRLTKTTHPLDAVIKAELSTAVDSVKAMVPLAIAQVVDYSAANAEQLLVHGAAVQRAYRSILIGLHSRTRVEGGDEGHILLVAKNLEQAADMAIDIMKTCHFVHYGTKYEKNTAA